MMCCCSEGPDGPEFRFELEDGKEVSFPHRLAEKTSAVFSVVGVKLEVGYWRDEKVTLVLRPEEERVET